MGRGGRGSAPLGRALTPEPILAAPCLMRDCDGRVPEGLAGHQCLPGAATLASRDIVRAVRRTAGGRRAVSCDRENRKACR